jgi:hypothetical protein
MEMGFLKKILGELKETTIQMIDDQYKFEREQLLGELCGHLQQFGVKGTRLDPGDPEGFRFPPIVMGCVKIEDRNLDVIIIQVGNQLFNYYYVVRADVNGLEDKLRADFKSDWHNHCCLKNDFRWGDKLQTAQEVSSPQWEGGELAQLLNADSDLTSTLYSEGLDRLEIRPDLGRRCVRISHPIIHAYKWGYSKKDMGPGDYTYHMGDEEKYTIKRKQYPTRGAFEAYDRIAYTIKKVLKTESK